MKTEKEGGPGRQALAGCGAEPREAIFFDFKLQKHDQNSSDAGEQTAAETNDTPVARANAHAHWVTLARRSHRHSSHTDTLS